MFGRQPKGGGGFQLADCDWLRGVAGGQNDLFASYTALAGGGQAGATPIQPGVALAELRTVASAADSAMLPIGLAGMRVKVFNSSANSADVFANPAVNKATGVADTINGSTNVTAYALAGGKSAEFFCPRDGIWGAILSA